MSGNHEYLLIDGHSVVHRVAPEVKIITTVVFTIGVAVTHRRAVVPLAIDAVTVGALLWLSGYRWRQLATRLPLVAPFLVLAAFLPFLSSGEKIPVGPVSVSYLGLWAAWNTTAKTLIGFGAALVLAGTTTVAGMIRGLDRLKVPAPLVGIISFMFRYLDLITAEMRRMRVAMTARGHDPRWLWQAKPLASAAGALFVRSYERGERVHAAMQARGFTGRMPELPSFDDGPGSGEGWGMGRQVAVAVAVASVAVVGAVVASVAIDPIEVATVGR